MCRDLGCGMLETIKNKNINEKFQKNIFVYHDYQSLDRRPLMRKKESPHLVLWIPITLFTVFPHFCKYRLRILSLIKI